MNALKKVSEKILNESRKDNKLEVSYLLTCGDKAIEEVIAFALDSKEQKVYCSYLIQGKIIKIPEWNFNVDDYLFKELDQGYAIAYMNIETHYNIWLTLLGCDLEVERREGLTKYIDFCQSKGITKDKITRETNFKIADVLELFSIKIKKQHLNDVVQN